MGLFDFFKKKGHQEAKASSESPKQTPKQESTRAKGGCCDAMNELGYIYSRQNNNLAVYWYTKAIRRGYEPARQRMLMVL